jgi:ferric-dicitrate binding protein FerR (iron transport regulator)
MLRDAPLSQVATELRRWYGIELRVTDSATARRRLTATFAGESPEQAMAIIGAALGARIERRGDTVIVR